MDIDELYEAYCKEAEIQRECTLSGDYKKGNISSDKLKSYNDMIKADFENYKCLLDKLLQSSNPNVLIWSGGTALDLNYEKELVIRKLTEIAKMKGIGVLRTDAKMTLKVRGILV